MLQAETHAAAAGDGRNALPMDIEDAVEQAPPRFELNRVKRDLKWTDADVAWFAGHDARAAIAYQVARGSGRPGNSCEGGILAFAGPFEWPAPRAAIRDR